MNALVVANWKMNPASLKEARKLFETTKKTAARIKKVSVIVAPPVIFLRELAGMQRGGKVGLSAQNVHTEPAGAHTGDISVPQVRDAKAGYVLVGHAERRALGETNEETRAKIAAVCAAQMTPIFCIGEHERTEDGEHFNFVREQIVTGLMDVPPAKLSKVIIAYEPVWAIGATETMKPRDMHEMGIFIRKTIVERFGSAGHTMKILYGGAVDATNAKAMLVDGDVKGFLVGRASVDAKAFVALLEAVAKA